MSSDRLYHYECWECGKDIFRSCDTNVRRSFCPGCREKFEEKRAIKKEKYLKIKQELMLTRALNTLEKIDNFRNFRDYLEPYKVLKEYCLENPTKVDSQYEAIAIMELLKNKINIKIQPKVLNYYCDIMLEDYKVILEIDGYFHKNRGEQDGERDREIRKELGFDWEIIRIPVKYLKKNPQKLMKAIAVIRERQKELRKDNYGNLPEWYSNRSPFKRMAGDI